MVCSRSKCHGYARKNPIQPVNAFSDAVDPRRLYPAHFDLMRNLYHSGQQPERWRMLDAAEVRLDEDGMEVEFTLVQQRHRPGVAPQRPGLRPGSGCGSSPSSSD